MDLFGRKAKLDAERLAFALEAVLADMLSATDFGMPVEDEGHPFHVSVKSAMTALRLHDGVSRDGR